MRAISMRPALLRRNSTSLTARSKRAAGLYAGAPRACETRGGNVRTAGRPIGPAAAINLRRGRRMKVPLVTFASRENEFDCGNNNRSWPGPQQGHAAAGAGEQRDELAPFQWQCLPCIQPRDTTAGNLLQCGILSGLMPLWVNLDRVDRAGTSIHIRYASKSDQIGLSQRTVAKFQKRT